MAKIFVSSTYLDLQEYRHQAGLVIRRMDHEDVAMEYYVAEDKRPVDKCLEDVAACDLYVGIFAWRYGWIPKKYNRRKLSITEMEYQQAVKKGKDCLIFLLDSKAPWPADFIDDDKTRIKKLREKLQERHTPGLFKSLDELGRLIAETIHKWEKDHGCISARILIPEFDLAAYFSALSKRYQRLDLDGLTPPQKEEYLQMQLRSIFVEQDVRENPPPLELPKEIWERLEREKEIHPEDLPEGISLEDFRRVREVYYEKPSLPVLDVLITPQYQHVIILGDPGSGKSTLARYLLLSLIDPAGDEKLRLVLAGYIPLLVELRSYAGLCIDNKCDTFLEFLEYLGKTEGWQLTQEGLHEQLKNDGRAIVIFDGLDEIFDPENREKITRQIVGFASNYPKARIVVTSRVIGYRRKILTDAGFAHFTLQDLNEEQVSKFVGRWYALALSGRPDDAKERHERIIRSFKESKSIRQLAGNPMLLTIMAIIGKHQELPRERWKLYDHAASVLIQHWDVNKHLKEQRVQADFIGEEDKKELLRRLAYKMQGSAGGLAGNYIHREQLEEEFEGYLKERYGQKPDRARSISQVMIDQFRERNFILSLYGANLYGFVHRAFLEYFCATRLVHKFEKTQEITLDQLRRDVYGAHWEDQSWHEVLRLICGMIDERFAGNIIDYLANELYSEWPYNFIKRPPWNVALAIQCMNEIRNLGSVSEYAEGLLRTVFSLFDLYMRCMDIPYPFEFLGEQVAEPIEKIGSSWPKRAILSQCLREYFLPIPPPFSNFFHLKVIGNCIGSIGRGLEDAHKVVLDYAKQGYSSYRILSMHALVKGWSMDSQTPTLIHDIAISDANESVRRIAITFLAEKFGNDPRTLPLLLDRAVNDTHEDVRSAAILGLAKNFHDDPQTLISLRDRVLNDDCAPPKEKSWRGSARKIALVSIIEDFRDDPQTLPLLFDRAVNDPREDVRSTAVSGLAKNFRDDLRTLPLILDRAVNDTHEDVRSAAISALTENFHDDPQTLRQLQHHIVSDPHQKVRSAVIRALAKSFRDDLRTLPLVLDRAVNDTHEDVRSDAIWALAKNFSDDSQTLISLRDRVLNDDYTPPKGESWKRSVRTRALSLIIEDFRDAHQTLPLLFDRAVNDPREDVRSTAVSGLAKNFRDDLRTLPLVLDRAVNDTHEDVRSAAISALTENFHDDPQTLRQLQHHIVSDPHQKVRSAVIRVLAKSFRDDLRTLPLILDRAVNDIHEDVRSAAISALAENFGANSETLSLLRDRVVNDPHEGVRFAAIFGMAQYFYRDPQTLALLQDCLKNDPSRWLHRRVKELFEKEMEGYNPIF